MSVQGRSVILADPTVPPLSVGEPLSPSRKRPFAGLRNPPWRELPFHPQGGIRATLWRQTSVAVLSAPTRTLPGNRQGSRTGRTICMSGNRTMKHLSIYRLSVLLCLLVLSGCARERAGRSVAETAAQAGATSLPVLAPVSTFTPVPTLGSRARVGGPPLASAIPPPPRRRRRYVVLGGRGEALPKQILHCQRCACSCPPDGGVRMKSMTMGPLWWS